MQLVVHLFNALRVLIVVDAVFSWISAPASFPRSLTKPLLDPFYSPLRQLLRPLTGNSVDLSPLIALGILYALQLALERGGRSNPS